MTTNAQEESKEVIYKLTGKDRKDYLQISDKIILPKGNLVGFNYHYLDTTRFYQKEKTITNQNQIIHIISLLEKCNISNKEFEMTSGTDLNIEYSDGKYFYLIPGKGNILISNSDTSLILKDEFGLIKTLNSIKGYELFDLNILKQTEKITITYKNNSKVINDPELIQELVSLFENAKATYATSCPFYNSKIRFEINGKIILAAPAHDACNVIIINNTYFEMNSLLHKKFIDLLKKYVRFNVGP